MKKRKSLDMEIQYRKGTLNANADALSRPTYAAAVVKIPRKKTIDPTIDHHLIEYEKLLPRINQARMGSPKDSIKH